MIGRYNRWGDLFRRSIFLTHDILYIAIGKGSGVALEASSSVNVSKTGE